MLYDPSTFRLLELFSLTITTIGQGIFLKFKVDMMKISPIC